MKKSGIWDLLLTPPNHRITSISFIWKLLLSFCILYWIISPAEGKKIQQITFKGRPAKQSLYIQFFLTCNWCSCLPNVLTWVSPMLILIYNLCSLLVSFLQERDNDGTEGAFQNRVKNKKSKPITVQWHHEGRDMGYTSCTAPKGCYAAHPRKARDSSGAQDVYWLLKN